MKKGEIIKLLEKRAKGFSYTECTEEFIVESDTKPLTAENKAERPNEENFQKNLQKDAVLLPKVENSMLECNSKRRGRPKKQPPKTMQLAKKKVTTYYVPPDMTAIKILMDLDGTGEVVPIEEVAKRREEILAEIMGMMEKE